MKALLLLLFALLEHTCVFAQNTTSVTIQAGSKISDVLTAADIFYYPQFSKGKVCFRNGTKSTTKLNYSHLADEMQFINPNGDTLALTDEKTIQFICIDKDSFYYDKGYVKFIGGNNKIKLAEKRVWVAGEIKQIGAYNSTSSLSSITSFTSYNNFGRTYDLVLNEDVALTKVGFYYFGDIDNHFVPASKKNLQILFPKEQRRIETYLKENKVDFNDKKDLEKIVLFLGIP